MKCEYCEFVPKAVDAEDKIALYENTLWTSDEGKMICINCMPEKPQPIGIRLHRMNKKRGGDNYNRTNN